ncbi:MAG: alpha/beta fold hydrolase [Chitinophagales bacterium]
MANQFKIDALRFGMSFGKKIWKTHPDMEMISLSNGKLRVLDTKAGKTSLVIIPDGPNIIEHHFDIIKQLRKQYRVIVFDLYGFGFSIHNGNYDYSFAKTNLLINELLDLLHIQRTNLVLPCANGFYGIAYAHAHTEKVNHLLLLQTPSLDEMGKWSNRIVPSYLKKPFLSQMLMPFMEKKFANKWYDYALPKGTDRKPYQDIAVEGIKNGGNFCLCSLTQGLAMQYGTSWELDSAMPVTLIFGDKDFTHKTTDFESILSYHKGIDIIRFEGCGHFPDLERTPQFLQIVKDKIKS